MERVLQSFKNLYKGDTPVKNHLFFALMLFIPSLLCGVMKYIDKDMPKEVIILLGIIVLVLGILSVIPSIFLAGYSVDFCKNRLNDKMGFPSLSWNLFQKGIKLIPLGFVWSLYVILFFGTLFLLPLAPLIVNAVHSSDKNLGIILFMLGFLFVILLIFVLCFLITPFLSYVTITYVNEGQYSARLFNPLIIVDFMKKSFKSTILVTLKFLLASFIISFGVTIVYLIIFLLYFALIAIIAMSSSKITVGNVAYAPITLFLVLPLLGFAGTFQMYVNSMIGYAQMENYIEIFQKEINV
ncbi:MAG: DUF4013 domain-containing protein [Candidatus Gastranaerophilales bacterium]|nr:DUF4013 domain-containing protein [Candidatus Gastranaerophilales bacterium]